METTAPPQDTLISFQPGMVIMLYQDSGHNTLPDDMARLVERLEREQHSGLWSSRWVVERLGTLLSPDILLTAETSFLDEQITLERLFALPEHEQPFGDLIECVGHLWYGAEMLASAALTLHQQPTLATPDLLPTLVNGLLAWLPQAHDLLDEENDDEADPVDRDHILSLYQSFDMYGEYCADVVEKTAGAATPWRIYVIARALAEHAREMWESFTFDKDDEDAAE